MNELYKKEKTLAEKYIKKYKIISSPELHSISIPSGWYDFVCELTDNLIDIGWDKNLSQVKEKFGGLRFYIENTTPELNKLIKAAEIASFSICPVCGELKTKKELHVECSKKNFW